MKNSFKRKYVITIILSILVFLFIGNKTYADNDFVAENSKAYQEWLELSEEERNNSISPLPYNIRLEEETGINIINRAVKDIFIPSKYDTRDKGIVIEKKNQMNCGLCWAFAANSCAEIKLALDGKTYQFSERHLDYETSKYDGWENSLNRQPGSGGNYLTSLAYYTRGSGPILEADMPFENNENKMELTDVPKNLAVQKIDDAVIFPNIFKRKDSNGNFRYMDANGNPYTTEQVKQIRNQIKENIITNGAVYAKIQSSGNEYNINNQEGYGDHMVTIIGWDDNYSKNNFKNVPTQDGAYIILNSWGEEWGQSSIGYVSYEDYIIETTVAGIKKVSDIQYDEIYQHDLSEMWGKLNTKYVMNIFTAEENEKLTEVMIGSYGNQTCNIYLMYENSGVKIAENVKIYPGYNTIKLSKEYSLNAGERFGIGIEQIGEEGPCIGGEINVDNTFTNVVVNPGETYASNDGANWLDCSVENTYMNACIKAYTKKDVKTLNISNIDGTVYEKKGGKLSFSIDASYTDKGKNADIKIYKGDTDVTNKFSISGGKIRGNGGFVKLICPSNTAKGKYTVKITLPGYETQSKTFRILGDGENPGEEEVTLERIEVTTSPTKIVYREGEVFDPTGMVVTAFYSDGTSKVITNYVVSPSIALTTNDKTITIYYSEYPINVNATINITILKQDIPEDELYVVFNGYKEKQDGSITYLERVQPNQTKANIKTNITTNGEIRIQDRNGNEANDDNMKVVTGDKLVIKNDKETKEYTIVVKGDTNGSGTADFSDMLKINKHRLNKVKLEGEFFRAGDIDENGKADFSDMLKINKFRLHKVDSL